MARLPQPGGDQGTWGTILNDFLRVSHNDDGTLKTNWFNVKNYGAKGDNVTDDSAAFQATITASGWPNQPATILVPPGTYRINSTIKFDGQGKTSTPSLVVIGYGATLYTETLGLTLVQLTNSIVSITRVSFLGFIFITNANGARGIIMTNSELCEFISCKFLGSYSLGVEINGVSSYNRFLSCEFGNMSRGILVSEQADYLQIANCSFNENLSGNGLNWIELAGATAAVTINNCVFYGSDATLPIIRSINTRNVIITACIFSRCFETGIQLGSYGSADNNVISGCQFLDMTKNSIHIYGGTKNTISNNKVTAGANYDAILIEQRYGNGGGSGNVISGNTGNGRYLVNEINGATKNIIMGNVAKSGTSFNIDPNSINANNLIV